MNLIVASLASTFVFRGCLYSSKRETAKCFNNQNLAKRTALIYEIQISAKEARKRNGSYLNGWEYETRLKNALQKRHLKKYILKRVITEI